MNILAIDQARNGAWCVYDYALKAPIAYGVFSFPTEQFTYAQAMVGICDVVKDLMDRYSISAVFIEDIQLRKNADHSKSWLSYKGPSFLCLNGTNTCMTLSPVKVAELL